MIELFSSICRGIGSSLRPTEVCSLIVKTKNCTNFVAALQETKLSELKLKHIITPNNSSSGLIYIFPEKLEVVKIADCRDCQAILYKPDNVLIINSYINPKDHQMADFFDFFNNLNVDAYEKVFLVGDHNAINPIDLSTPFSSKVKSYDHRIQRFQIIE